MLFLLISVSPVVAQEFDNPILNPAAVYCDSLGYQYTIQTDATGDEGFCILPSGETVNSWQFFLGDIAHEYNYCGLKGYQTQTSTDPAITDRYLTSHVGVCVLPDTTTVEIAEFMKMRYDLKGWWEDRSTRPVFEPIDDTEVEEGTLLEIALVATDPDNDPLSFTGYPLPDGATITDTTFRWTPAVGQAGNYHIAFTVSDGQLEAFQYANIIVKAHVQNNPPELKNPGDKNVLEGELLTINLDATDPDNNPLTYSFTSIKTLLGAIISGNIFTWTPGSGTAGKYPVTFNVTDTGGLSDEESINITVNAPTTNVPTTVKIVPKTINLGSKGYFLAFVTLPETYKGATIDMNTVSCSGAPAQRMMRLKLLPRIVGFVFKTSDLQGVEVGKKATLNIKGELKNKGTTYTFTGADSVKVISKPTWQPDDIKDISKLSDDQLFKKFNI